jgi:[ribosomal protein S5]-alanine N-acetyltransferase
MTIDTNRLVVEPISEMEAQFVFELLNTEGWIKYIGDRNITSESDAAAYINKIREDPNITYWTVKLKPGRIAIGVVTLIKRDYLEFNDIGFAFLPKFSGKGYAYEAANAVLLNLVKSGSLDHVVAITMDENPASIKLIERLGLQFKKNMSRNEDSLRLYQASKDEILIREN